MKIKENDGVADIGLKVAVEEKNSAWGRARGASGQPERRKKRRRRRKMKKRMRRVQVIPPSPRPVSGGAAGDVFRVKVRQERKPTLRVGLRRSRLGTMTLRRSRL